MPLTVLGIKDIWIENNWVEFDSVFLNNNRRYHLELLIKARADIQDISTFKIGYSYKIKNGSIVQRVLTDNYRVENRVIGVIVDIPSTVDKNMPVKFFIKRYLRFDRASRIPKTEVTLSIDKDSGF